MYEKRGISQMSKIRPTVYLTQIQKHRSMFTNAEVIKLIEELADKN